MRGKQGGTKSITYSSEVLRAYAPRSYKEMYTQCQVDVDKSGGIFIIFCGRKDGGSGRGVKEDQLFLEIKPINIFTN